MINKETLEKIYENEFHHDPVYRLVLDSKLGGYLYPDSLLTMELEKTYSTIEVGKMIGRKDSTIRNYFNTELVDYINPEKVGNLYRLNYFNILKIHMISLLYEKGGKNKTQIAFELGMKGSVKLGNEDNSFAAPQIQTKEIEMIKQYLSLESIKNKWLVRNNELQQKINKRQEIQLEFNTLTIKKEQLVELTKQREVETGYIESLTDALKSVSEQEQQNRFILEQANKKRGIFSWFGRKNTVDLSEEQIASSLELEVLKKEVLETREQKEERKANVVQFDKRLNELSIELEQLNQEIEEIENNIQEQRIYIQEHEKKLLGDNNDGKGN